MNGEYYLPPGDKEGLYAMVREVAEGYTVVGTTYEYNDKNQLISRHNLVRDEVHTYTYDHRGNLIHNGRSQFRWNDENRLVEVLFPEFPMTSRPVCTTQYPVKGWTLRAFETLGPGCSDPKYARRYPVTPSFQDIMARLVGLECWYVFSDGGSSDITLAMGHRIPRIPKLAQRWPEGDPRRYHGEYSLWIQCPWELECEGQILVTSAEYGDESNWFAEMSGALINARVTRVDIIPPTMSLSIAFGNGAVLNVDNTLAESYIADLAWSLRGDERLLAAIGPRGERLK